MTEVLTMSNSMIPQYSTEKFTDVWDEASDFVSDYKSSGLYITNNKISDDSATTLYYLLYARYGNSPLANRDVNQFKYKVFSVIFQYGPTWEKELDIQAKIRAISDNPEADVNIYQGSKAIHNQALNPQTAPSTASLEELEYINQQNTTNYKKSPLEGYAMLAELLRDDLTKRFVDRFNICFKKFVSNERPILFVTEEDTEDDGN